MLRLVAQPLVTLNCSAPIKRSCRLPVQLPNGHVIALQVMCDASLTAGESSLSSCFVFSRFITRCLIFVAVCRQSRDARAAAAAGPQGDSWLRCVCVFLHCGSIETGTPPRHFGIPDAAQPVYNDQDAAVARVTAACVMVLESLNRMIHG
jgi:hypothetical protein